MTHFYVDVGGNYLGGWSDPGASTIPAGAVEVPSAPADARQIWGGAAWGAIPYSPAELLGQKFAAGCAIVSSGANPALAGTWALDPTTQQQITTLATSAAQFGLPRGQTTISYPDASGTPHTLNVAAVGVLFVTLRDYIDELYTTEAILEQGGTASWPAQPVTVA